MKVKITKQKGISLIVLVVTIIVMIILSTIIILTLASSDIRSKTYEAVSSSDITTVKENILLMQADWEAQEDKLKKKYTGFKEYAEEKLKESGIDYISVSNNGVASFKYVDENEDIAIIPEGFVVSKVTGENTIENGLVIYEGDEPVTDENVETARETRNQFVWVPVDDMDLFKRTTTYVVETVEDIEDPGDSYSEPYRELSLPKDSTGEWAEWTAMKASVKENGGFYIARYEAGKEGTDTVVSKKRATVWNNISWGTSMTEIGKEGAVYRARQMYKGSKSVVSTLCYGVEWDAALRFIATKDETYPTNSTGKGNYTESIAVTGSNDDYAVNNIYDMAGNAEEWTMEALSIVVRLLRGGTYSDDSASGSASFRVNGGPGGADGSGGFRVALYIK